jgi:hypothetical protein
MPRRLSRKRRVNGLVMPHWFSEEVRWIVSFPQELTELRL